MGMNSAPNPRPTMATLIFRPLMLACFRRNGSTELMRQYAQYTLAGPNCQRKIMERTQKGGEGAHLDGDKGGPRTEGIRSRRRQSARFSVEAQISADRSRQLLLS